MSLFRRLAALSAVLLLCACVTAHTVDPSAIRSYFIEAVSVHAPPRGDGDIEVAVLKAAGLDPTLPESGDYLRSPAGEAAVSAVVAEQIRGEFARIVSPKLTGPAKAKLEVKVISVDVPSAVRRIIIGGHPNLVAVVTLVDSKTGRPVVTSPNLSVSMPSGQGVLLAPLHALGEAAVGARPPIVRLADKLAEEYVEWLLKAP
ncbi:hypothetical protein [Alsobacter sp. R-9]